jgi:hypothetical protein
MNVIMGNMNSYYKKIQNTRKNDQKYVDERMEYLHGQSFLIKAIRVNNIFIAEKILNSNLCTSDYLCYQGHNFDEETSLITSIYKRSPISIKILQHENCSTRLLNLRDKTGNTCLICAINYYPEIVQLILNSKYCSPELLLHKDDSANICLILAAKNKPDIMKLIVNSPHCTYDLLKNI